MKKKRLAISKKFAFGVICVASLLPSLALADVGFEVEGLDSKLKKNVNVYLNAIPEAERKQNFRLQSRIIKEITQSLQAVGYFHPKITFAGSKENLRGKTILLINVDAGEPVVLKEVNIHLSGEAQTDPEFAALIKKAPQIGEVLNQGRYEEIKANIQKLAINRGYFDGEYTTTKLEISPDLNEAFIQLHYDSGVRYRYGEIDYHNSQIALDRLNSLRDFQPGQPYLVTELGAFNQKLSSTNWFTSALVEPDVELLKDGIVPINVNLEPAPRNLFETGLGYSTDTGPRVKVSWKKPWFNSRGHSLDTDLYVSKPRQTLETMYKIPLQNVDTEFYMVQLGIENIDDNDTRSLETTASVSRHWMYEEGWQRILYLRWLYSDFTQAGISDDSNLLLPGVSFSRLRSRGGMMPYWGDKQAITFEMSSKLWASDINLYRVFGETAWIRSVDNANKHRFITRASAGINFTDNIDKVPPSLRFFTGGDNSVRGYSYESISPVDAAGELIGGKYLITASVEYDYQIAENWWLAAFTDMGDAWSGIDPDWKTSAGLGVRWRSPIGPVSFDIAHGFQNPDQNFMLHFSLGPEL